MRERGRINLKNEILEFLSVFDIVGEVFFPNFVNQIVV